MKLKNKAFIVASMVLGFMLSIVSFLVYFMFIDLCAYHPPQDKEPGPIFSVFFDIIISHPEPNFNIFWFSLIVGLFFGIFVFFIINNRKTS